MKKEKKNNLYQAIRNNIVAKKTTELVLLFHENITKLVFLLPKMSQKSFKVLNKNITFKSYNNKHELGLLQYISCLLLIYSTGFSGRLELRNIKTRIKIRGFVAHIITQLQYFNHTKTNLEVSSIFFHYFIIIILIVLIN